MNTKRPFGQMVAELPERGDLKRWGIVSADGWARVPGGQTAASKPGFQGFGEDLEGHWDDGVHSQILVLEVWNGHGASGNVENVKGWAFAEGSPGTFCSVPLIERPRVWCHSETKHQAVHQAHPLNYRDVSISCATAMTIAIDSIVSVSCRFAEPD